MRIMRVFVTLLGVLALLGASAIVVGADHSQDRDDLEQHCRDHQGHPNKVDDPAPGSVHKTTVDGTDVWLHFSDDLHSVEFFADEDGTQPITVEFCIKAGDKAGGEEIGQEGHVSWENRGGQTPEISYVIVYRIVDDEDECPHTLTLSPPHGENALGDTHTVTATVTDPEGGACAGVEVRFEVDPADGADPSSGTATTDGDGQASFSYTRHHESNDTITACTTEDGDAPAACDTTEHIHDTATKDWVDDEPPAECPHTLTLSPPHGENALGDTHTVTATVTDSEGGACAGVEVRFEVESDGDPDPDHGVATTDGAGQASFSYTNTVVGSDTITACTTDDGEAPASCDEAGVTIMDTATKDWVDIVEPGFWTCEARVIEVLGLELFGANVDEVECMDDEDELLSLVLGGEEGDPGAIEVELARAETQLDDGGPFARATVAGAAIKDGDGNIVVAAFVLESEASGSCEDGQPVLDSSSSVAAVHVLGEEPVVDADEPVTIDVLDPLVGTIHLNHTETEEDGDEARQTQRAFWWEGFPLGDVIIAEATADHHGNPC